MALSPELKKACDDMIKHAQFTATMLPGRDKESAQQSLARHAAEYAPAMALRLIAADYEATQLNAYVTYLRGILDENKIDYE